jgi:hypothetical protein
MIRTYNEIKEQKKQSFGNKKEEKNQNGEKNEKSIKHKKNSFVVSGNFLLI